MLTKEKLSSGAWLMDTAKIAGLVANFSIIGELPTDVDGDLVA